MQKIKIDKNIPVPKITYKTSSYPLNDLEVDDSFFASISPLDALKLRQNIYQWGKRNKVKFCIKQEKDGLRVWRIE